MFGKGLSPASAGDRGVAEMVKSSEIVFCFSEAKSSEIVFCFCEVIAPKLCCVSLK